MRVTRRKVKLTVEKLVRLETKYLRRIERLKTELVNVMHKKDQLKKALTPQ